MNAIAAARDFIGRGFAPLPIPTRKKGPVIEDWPTFRTDANHVHDHFRANGNVGVILGAASGGLADIDLDCMEAIDLAAEVLPPTRSIFGRPSKPASHLLYRVSEPCPSKKFADPVSGGMIVELRGDGGLQTVFPPSTHPSGERVAWEVDDEPARLDYAELRTAVAKLAARVVAIRHGDGTATDDPATWVLSLANAPDEAARAVSEWLGANPPAHRAAAPSRPAIDISDRARCWAEAGLDQECATVASAAKGRWNDAINRAAFSIGQIVAGGSLEEAYAIGRLKDAASSAGIPAGDAKSRIAGGIYAGKKEPRHRPDDDARAPIAVNNEPPLPPEKPRPLRRAVPEPDPYPTDALGLILGPAANAIVDLVQLPHAIAGGAVLAVAALAVQAHVNVYVPAPGQLRPVSLNLLTLATSGDRKTSAMKIARLPVDTFEKWLGDDYEVDLKRYKIAKRKWDFAIEAAKKKAAGDADKYGALIEAIGDEPLRPLFPTIIPDGSPTIEGLLKRYRNSRPSLGISTDEGGAFIGGHAMSDDSKMRTLAAYNSLWDGSPIKRCRADDGDEFLALYHRRMTVDVMVQPDVAAEFMSDPIANGSGFLARFLPCYPASLAGERLHKDPSPESQPAIDVYTKQILSILRKTPNYIGDERSGLDPRILKFDKTAERQWIALSDGIETEQRLGGRYASIRPFASKLGEHIARIAAVLTCVEDIDAQEINSETLERAAFLADFYATEALRLLEAGACSPELARAEKLLTWLKDKWGEPLIGLVAIYKFGPGEIRDASSAKKAVGVLEEHGWLKRAPGPELRVAGKPVREAWHIVRDE